MPGRPVYPPTVPPKRKFSGKRMKQVRQANGIRPEALAIQIGRSLQMVFNYESGRMGVSADLAAHIADLLGVPLDELFEPTEDA